MRNGKQVSKVRLASVFDIGLGRFSHMPLVEYWQAFRFWDFEVRIGTKLILTEIGIWVVSEE